MKRLIAEIIAMFTVPAVLALLLASCMLCGCKSLKDNGIGVSTVETAPHLDVFAAGADRETLKKKLDELKFEKHQDYLGFLAEITYLQNEVDAKTNEAKRIAAEKQAEIERLAAEAASERAIKERKAKAQNAAIYGFLGLAGVIGAAGAFFMITGLLFGGRNFAPSLFLIAVAGAMGAAAYLAIPVLDALGPIITAIIAIVLVVGVICGVIWIIRRRDFMQGARMVEEKQNAALHVRDPIQQERLLAEARAIINLYGPKLLEVKP